MAHEIQADSNTAVGYNFLTKEYYIKNLDTKTTLNTPVEAKQILDITAPFNTVSEADILNLSIVLEPIKSISYVWEDTGKYIKGIYFNEYIDNAMIYNEPYLYIKGSVEMWDVSSSLSQTSIRDFFWSYYNYNLGLDLSVETMDAIIAYFYKIQSPYVYNNIQIRSNKDDVLMYTNKFTMNNADKSSRGEYIGTKNPKNIYSMDVYNVVSTGQITEKITYNIYSMQVTGNNILLDTTVEEGELEVGSTFTVHGTPNDKGYTVAEIETEELLSGKQVTSIKTNEIFDEDFTATMYDYSYIELPDTKTVEENVIIIDTEPMVKSGDLLQMRGSANVDNLIVDRVEGNKIILNKDTSVGVHTENDNKLYTSSYKVLKIGFDNYSEVIGATGINKIINNKVYIAGWLYKDNFKVNQEVYINYGNNKIVGPYTISSVVPTSMNASTLVEGYIQLNGNPGNYTSTIGEEPASVEVRNFTQIDEDSITVEKVPLLKEDDIIEIKNSDHWNGSYTVDYTESVSGGTKIWVKRNDFFQGFGAYYDDSDEELTKKAVVQLRAYSEQILLNMTYSKRADKMPTGEFMLDNNQQFTSYLVAYKITPPTSTNYADLNQPVTLKYYLGDGLDVENMDCVGLYSEVFEN